MRWRHLLASGVAVVALVVVLEIGPDDGPVVLPAEAPDGFVVRYPAGTVPGGWTYTKAGVVFDHASGRSGGLAVRVYDYHLVVFEKLFSYQQHPAPSSVNAELNIDSPDLGGIGLGADKIRCSDGQPRSCISWVYEAHVGNQLVHVSLSNDRGVEPISADTFRELVRELFG